MTDRTNYCTGCKERQDRIEALTAEIERLNKSAECLAETRRLAVKDVAELEAENERLRLFVQYTADCCEDDHIVTKAYAALDTGIKIEATQEGGWKEAGQPWLWTYDPHLKEKQP